MKSTARPAMRRMKMTKVDERTDWDLRTYRAPHPAIRDFYQVRCAQAARRFRHGVPAARHGKAAGRVTRHNLLRIMAGR